MNREINLTRGSESDITREMASLVRPGSAYVGVTDTVLSALGLAEDVCPDLRAVPLRGVGQRLLALRFLIENGGVWRKFFAYKAPLEKSHPGSVELFDALWERLERLRATVDLSVAEAACASMPLVELAQRAVDFDGQSWLELCVALSRQPALAAALRLRLSGEAAALTATHHDAADVLYLLSQELHRLPATTVGGGRLRYLVVADKGEMGVRAVREALSAGLVPVAVFSEQDDEGALSVRVAEAGGGFAIGLSGSFRESYANPAQIAARVAQAYEARFGTAARQHLAESALYPGYGPLAENTVAIQHFRRAGLCFCGPSQDVVEQAGDKRKFRLLAQAIDPKAVTPGIVMENSEPAVIEAAIFEGARAKKFTFPGRLKAANGGGGRGQVVIQSEAEVHQAVKKVLAEIQVNGWDAGVMFEQNISQTTHLEVQVVRDRFGNARHFGMRDCTEQRASQKIQEEAPPALLSHKPELQARMCEIAVEIAQRVHYVGACTVELMYKDGHFYLLEMNTRIQVEHPVTEEAHRIRRAGKLEPLNLVQLQLRVARGLPLDFAQDDVVATRVAREFRINAESYKPEVKDSRDGKKGLFLPNSGVFDVIEVPTEAHVQKALKAAKVEGIAALGVRFDCGFEVGDDLVNKDPTFGKLIVSVEPHRGEEARAYELLRLASLEVLREMVIKGRQVTPSGKVLNDRPFETNLTDHVEVLESEMLQAHSQGRLLAGWVRHVGWLIDYLRARHAAEAAEAAATAAASAVVSVPAP